MSNTSLLIFWVLYVSILNQGKNCLKTGIFEEKNVKTKNVSLTSILTLGFMIYTTEQKHSIYPDHRAIMVLFGCRGVSTSIQWYGVHYITGFQPTRHSSTNSITRHTIKEKVNSVTAHTHGPHDMTGAQSTLLL